VRDGRAEQREDSVAGRLHDVAVVAAHRVDHQLQRRINDRARFFGIEVLLQLRRALDIREQRGDRFALPFYCGRVCFLCSYIDRLTRFTGGGLNCGRYERQRCSALVAEFRAWRIRRSASGALRREGCRTLAAELRTFAIVCAALCTANFSPSRHLLTQLIEERFGVFQVGGVESFGEPVVDFGEHCAGLVAVALFVKEAGEARGCAQFP
jgi:hypothetical protein